jgi:hypothetical protein
MPGREKTVLHQPAIHSHATKLRSGFWRIQNIYHRKLKFLTPGLGFPKNVYFRSRYPEKVRIPKQMGV